MRPLSRLISCLPLVLAACGGQGPVQTTQAPAPPSHPLAYLMAQQVIVAPVHSLREADPLGFTGQIRRSREYLRLLDDEIDTELAARGLKTQWVYPEAIVRASRGSPSYAVDPYALAADPLRTPGLAAGTRIGDPLATQLRTMVALQESARFVLVPIELRFDRDASGQGVAVLRTALLDARAGEVRWVGEVRSDPSATLAPTLLSSLAAHFADLFTAR